MKPGSVVVDMAAANGGNVAGHGGRRDRHHAPTASGSSATPTCPAACRPRPASSSAPTSSTCSSCSRPARTASVVLDLDDVVQRGMTVCRDGETLWPPPPVQVSAAPGRGGHGRAEPKAHRSRRRTRAASTSGWALAAVLFAPRRGGLAAGFLGHFTVFALAVIVGFYVISNVAHALHTPLMSETNAISGIIVVGGAAPARQRQRCR